MCAWALPHTPIASTLKYWHGHLGERAQLSATMCSASICSPGEPLRMQGGVPVGMHLQKIPSHWWQSSTCLCLGLSGPEIPPLFPSPPPLAGTTPFLKLTSWPICPEPRGQRHLGGAATLSSMTSSPPSHTPVSCSGQVTPLSCGGLCPADTCSRAQAVMLEGSQCRGPSACRLGVAWHIRSSPFQRNGTLTSCQGAKNSHRSH